MFALEDFARLFRDTIRVRFAWDRFERERWPIGARVATATDQLAGLLTPWYMTAGGRECDFDDPGARPLTLLDIWKGPGSAGVPERRRSHVEHVCEHLASTPSPAFLVVATYSLGAGRELILDGSHRLAAVGIAGVPARVLTLCVEGPMEPAALPDLAHWVS